MKNGHRKNGLAALVHYTVAHPQRATIRLRARWPHFQYFGLCKDGVTRLHRSRPTKLVDAGGASAAGAEQALRKAHPPSKLNFFQTTAPELPHLTLTPRTSAP